MDVGDLQSMNTDVSPEEENNSGPSETGLLIGLSIAGALIFICLLVVAGAYIAFRRSKDQVNEEDHPPPPGSHCSSRSCSRTSFEEAHFTRREDSIDGSSVDDVHL